MGDITDTQAYKYLHVCSICLLESKRLKQMKHSWPIIQTHRRLIIYMNAPCVRLNQNI
jgi:hypothetical protein